MTFFARRKSSHIFAIWLLLPQFGQDFIETIYRISLVFHQKNSKSIPCVDDFHQPNVFSFTKIANDSSHAQNIVSSREDKKASRKERIISSAVRRFFTRKRYGFLRRKIPRSDRFLSWCNIVSWNSWIWDSTYEPTIACISLEAWFIGVFRLLIVNPCASRRYGSTPAVSRYR